jgi:hypothetical protein
MFASRSGKSMIAASRASFARLACRVYKDAIPPPRQPKRASSCASVAPLSAARVAPAFRKPCAEPSTAASLHASRNQLPKDSLAIGRPFLPAMNVNSPIGPASIDACNGGKIGMTTTWPVFSVRMVAMPFLTWGLPSRTASPRRRPVYNKKSKATRSRVPRGQCASNAAHSSSVQT